MLFELSVVRVSERNSAPVQQLGRIMATERSLACWQTTRQARRSACFSSFSEELSNSANVTGRGLRDAGTSCANGTTAISWNQSGPQSPAGATGAAGWLKAEGGQRVGTGVVDPDGKPPMDEWGLIVKLLISKRFKNVVRGLISGERVRSDDAVVQISLRRVTDTRLDIRIREASPARQPIMLDLVLEAIDPACLKHPDHRGLASPALDKWRVVQNETTSDWELYNCRIRSLDPANP